MKHRLPPGVRARIFASYQAGRNFFPALWAIMRGAGVLLVHLSADIVPSFYWRRLKRWWAARGS